MNHKQVESCAALHGKRLITPAKASIPAVQDKIREILKAGGSLPQGALIHRMNPMIRGWGEHYRHVVGKQVFSDILIFSNISVSTCALNKPR